jgi:hypothetical protein
LDGVHAVKSLELPESVLDLCACACYGGCGGCSYFSTTLFVFVLIFVLILGALLSISDPTISFAGSSLTVRVRCSFAAISLGGTGLRLMPPSSSVLIGLTSSECNWAFSSGGVGAARARFCCRRRRSRKKPSRAMAMAREATPPTVEPAMTPVETL